MLCCARSSDLRDSRAILRSAPPPASATTSWTTATWSTSSRPTAAGSAHCRAIAAWPSDIWTITTWPADTRAIDAGPSRPRHHWPIDANARPAPTPPSDRTAPTQAAAPMIAAPIPAGAVPTVVIPTVTASAPKKLNRLDGTQFVGRCSQAHGRADQGGLRRPADRRSCKRQCGGREDRRNRHSHRILSC